MQPCAVATIRRISYPWLIIFCAVGGGINIRLSRLLANQEGAKSTALKALTVPLAVLACGMVVTNSGVTGWIAPGTPWVSIFFGALFSLTWLTFITAFIYLLIYDRESLRSEAFSLRKLALEIRKLALEKGVYGDDTSGLFDPDDEPSASRPPRRKQSKASV